MRILLRPATVFVLTAVSLAQPYPLAAQEQSKAVQKAEAVQTGPLALECGTGQVNSVTLVNSRSKSTKWPACVGAPRSIWTLVLTGKPQWSNQDVSLVTDDGQSFKPFCFSSEGRQQGVWVTTKVFDGPDEAKRVTCRCGKSTIELEFGKTK
jgi:hypothetical protein